MTPVLILSIVFAYFLVLIGISFVTSKGATNETFFLANKKSPWFLVAFGMIGASLSGITFISIPGQVGNPATQFGYMQMVFGYLVGYLIIAYVLMPIYYRLNLTSIYGYLKQRFGNNSHKIGAFYFLLSRIIGASIRLLLVANVLQQFVCNDLGVPFELTVLFSILLIWVYTFKGGIKTIIWTDTLQTLFMLLSLGFTVYYISNAIDFSETGGMIKTITDSEFSKIFYVDDWNEKNHFVKMFLGGIFLAVGMTGLDQDMMQKNLSCPNIKSAQKNMVSFALLLVFINLVFLTLGALLYMYANKNGIEVPFEMVENDLGELIKKTRPDLLFPKIALQTNMGIGIGILFLLGLIAAAYSSADSALTSLTTSVCVDFLGNKKGKINNSLLEGNKPKQDELLDDNLMTLDEEKIVVIKEVSQITRRKVHILMSALLFVVVIILHHTLSISAIWQLITLAGYTYGPLIGLFFFGIITKRKINDQLVFIVCLLAPVLSYIINLYSPDLLSGFKFGATLIIVNSLLTYLGLYFISRKKQQDVL
jgi:Na+/proline symporter